MKTELRMTIRKMPVTAWLSIFALFAFSLSGCLDTGDDGRGRGRDDDDNDKYEAGAVCEDIVYECEEQLFGGDESVCKETVEDLAQCRLECATKKSTCGEINDCLFSSAAASEIVADYCGDEFVDGDDTHVDGDGVEPDGDEIDPDGDDITDNCEGSCNPEMDSTYCVGGDLCICEMNIWKFYDCDIICQADDKYSQGCGNAGLTFDYCICGFDPPDGDETTDGDDNPDGDDVTDGDEEQVGECSGACNPETTPLVCIDEMNLCACGDSSSLEVLNCNEICVEADYSGATECGDNPNTGMDTCWCYETECESDQDCVDKEMDYCVLMGDSSVCGNRCDLNLCSDAVPCMNVGVGEGCGICYDTGMPTCSGVGETCGDGGICSDLCELTSGSCYPICEAAANSCGSGELCFPLNGEDGNVKDGVCIDYGASCPSCGDLPK